MWRDKRVSKCLCLGEYLARAVPNYGLLDSKDSRLLKHWLKFKYAHNVYLIIMSTIQSCYVRVSDRCQAKPSRGVKRRLQLECGPNWKWGNYNDRTSYPIQDFSVYCITAELKNFQVALLKKKTYRWKFSWICQSKPPLDKKINHSNARLYQNISSVHRGENQYPQRARLYIAKTSLWIAYSSISYLNQYRCIDHSLYLKGCTLIHFRIWYLFITWMCVMRQLKISGSWFLSRILR